jgi:hypothetical protein
MDDLSAAELAALKELLEQLTPGPWTSMVEGRDHQSGESFIRTPGGDIYLTGASATDQDFIAAARQDMARLLAEIERARERMRGRPTAAE